MRGTDLISKHRVPRAQPGGRGAFADRLVRSFEQRVRRHAAAQPGACFLLATDDPTFRGSMDLLFRDLGANAASAGVTPPRLLTMASALGGGVSNLSRRGMEAGYRLTSTQENRHSGSDQAVAHSGKWGTLPTIYSPGGRP